ncbi:MAG: hypothetical protein WC445_04165 [Patescibacteria group bacterium]
MKKLFEGGTKGRIDPAALQDRIDPAGLRDRLFENSAFGGKGEWKMKKGIMLVTALVGVLVLVGWGCGNSAAPTDTNSDMNVSETSSDSVPEVTSDTTGEIPAGWTEYRNEQWGVNFIYPAGWQYQEYSETVEGEEVATLAFSDQELPETLPPEPLFPIMVFRDARTVESAMSDYTEAVAAEDITLGSRVVKKIIYYSNILEQNDRVYLIPLRDGILKLFVPDSASYVSTAETMIANLTETE